MRSDLLIPLRVFSCYSLRVGVIRPEVWAKRAADFGLPAIALTDINSLMGSVVFVKAARALGIKPIIGIELVLGDLALTLLARNARGYAACSRLISQLYAGHMKDPVLAVVQDQALEDLIVLCADPGLLARTKGLIDGRTALYAALNSERPEDSRALKDCAKALQIPLVAADPAIFLKRSDHKAHRILRAIAKGTLVARLEPKDVWPFHPAGSFAREALVQAADQEAIANSRRIAEACEDFTQLGRPALPHYALPSGQNAAEWLRQLSFEGARRRYGDPLPRAVQNRLERELEVIIELGFPGYFLVVREIVAFAQERQIPFVGRGSAADSLVVHCLGWTRVCPIEQELVFERFLSRSRPNLPDVDLDFCWRRRDEVIAHVYERYGRDHVATISTHVRYRLRSAYREAAKALGHPPGAAAEGSDALPHHFEGRLDEAIARYPECRRLAERPALRAILEAAESIRGLPRHLGMHPGGLVIANGPVTDHSPLVPSAKGPLITQHEMRAIEALGLVKMDLLGQRSLSTIGDALQFLAQKDPPVNLDLRSLSPKDPGVTRLLEEGRTLGCFQVESPGMRKLLVGLKANDRDDLTHAIALIRPGPANSGMKEAFVQRRRGEEPVDFEHPRLAKVLGKTLGIMLFQEDILRVSAALSGWSLADGDLVRSALGKKKDPVLLAGLAERYAAGCTQEGIPKDVADKIWARIQDFAAFSFCKAHAATYGQLAYEELWLKAHHPAAFFCAVLNNDRGYYPERVYLEEARRFGVRFLLPDINRSGIDFQFEGGAIRMGLRRLKGLSSAHLEALMQARAKAPFLSLPDLLGRVALDRRTAAHLIRCGALDAFDRPRPEQLWRLELLLARGPIQPKPSLFGDLLPSPQILPRLVDYPESKKRRDEYELLGMTAEGTESVYGRDLNDASIVLARELSAHINRSVTCTGWVSATRRTRTKEGRMMRFLSLEDATGMIDTVLFPDVYEAFGHELIGEGPYRVEGRVTSDHGALVLELSRLQRLEAQSGS